MLNNSNTSLLADNTKDRLQLKRYCFSSNNATGMGKTLDDGQCYCDKKVHFMLKTSSFLKIFLKHVKFSIMRGTVKVPKTKQTNFFAIQLNNHAMTNP
jgi:hypothetical protein